MLYEVITETLERWMESYREVLELDIRPADWIRYCDLMGLQRNLKIVGIFSRLHYRDGKAGYIEIVITSYSIHYTKLYDCGRTGNRNRNPGPERPRGRAAWPVRHPPARACRCSGPCRTRNNFV